MMQNKYLRQYHGEQSPVFNYEELEFLAQDKDLHFTERLQFKKTYLHVMQLITEGLPKSNVVVYVCTNTGTLEVKTGNLVNIEGQNDEQLTRDEVERIAFDPGTPEDLAGHYLAILVKVRSWITKYKIDLSRILFYRNPISGKLSTYFD